MVSAFVQGKSEDGTIPEITRCSQVGVLMFVKDIVSMGRQSKEMEGVGNLQQVAHDAIGSGNKVADNVPLWPMVFSATLFVKL